MIEWIVIGLLIIIALFYAKMRHVKHRFFVIFVVLIIVFFYVSVSQVVKSQNASLNSFTGWVTVGKAYFTWLGNLGGNIQSLAGNAIKMNWMGNSTG